MKSRGKLGAQNKVPRVVMDRAQRASLEALAISPVRLMADAMRR